MVTKCDNSDSTDRSAQAAKGELSIFETTAQLLNPAFVLENLPKDKILILDAVRELLSGFGSGSMEKVENSLLKLGAGKESDLFQKVGSMTRSLHNSLSDFKRSLDRGNVTINTTNIPDAANKLESVIAMTHEAAQRVLASTEKQSEVLREARADLQALKQQMDSPSWMTDPQIKAAMEGFMFREEKRIEELERNNSAVLMAQEFQDLTGQALKKVIKLVTDLENNLVSLIQVFGSDLADEKAAPEQEESKLAQDDVDSVLSSFGF